MNQIELHLKIKELLSKNENTVSEELVHSLINTNNDARDYFFLNADDRWLEWLWRNGFLNAIKDKAPDPNSYSFRMPELQYLFKVVEKKPDLVSEIICSFEISNINFNPEVLDQFTRISSKLPARLLKKVVNKIRDEKWLNLMGQYTQYSFEYKDMFKALNKDQEYDSILALSEAVLQIRSKEEIEERKKSYRGDDIFYIHDLSDTEVFNYLANMPEAFIERALSIVVNTFSQAINDQGNYLLMDEDFFTLKLSDVSRDTYREGYKFLAATIVELTRKIFSIKNNDSRKIFDKYFAKMPENQVSGRLKLFVMSMNPKLFIEDLETYYFRLFETEKILDILYGAEYESALKIGFSLLSNTRKREYVKRVIDLFSNFKDDEEKRWKRHYASCILSTISEQLIQNEKVLAYEKEFKIDPEYKPEPSIVGRVRSGTVTPKSPISTDDFASLSIKEIAEKLKGELSPIELQKKYQNDDFLNPRDADGVAGQLKNDIKIRIHDYLTYATLFFDRDNLIQHYTNAYLQGIKDALSENRNQEGNYNYDELFKLLLEIKESCEKNNFNGAEKDSEGRWLSNWNSVHLSIADLIEELIKLKDKKTLLNFKLYRSRILGILNYLFDYNNPVPEDEKLKTATMTVKRSGESEYSISDPFSIAINSVRGRTFQTLLHFIYQDASNFDTIKLSNEVKALFEKVLKKKKTRAIMFMFGHYLPSFYFRDMTWTRSRFNEIFESTDKDKYLHLATWEGYLSNNLYQELFFEPYIQDLYSTNITLSDIYPKQKFFKDPQESIAVHFGLAFINYEEFGFTSKLFSEFLDKASPKQLSELINFLGKTYISSENNIVLTNKENTWRIKRLRKLWTEMLKTKNNPSLLKEFGTWIETSSNVFSVKWLANKISQTLDLTNGDLEWNYGLIKSIEELAKVAPQETLHILEKHFLAQIENTQKYFRIQEDKEWYNAFKILYAVRNKKLKGTAYELINKLIQKGGRQFWVLEDIVDGK